MKLKASEAAVIAERRFEKIINLTKDAASIYSFMQDNKNLDEFFNSFEVAYDEFKNLLKEAYKDADSER